ncbi:hypothetical protein [Pyrolobus fumarii]|nr:hypothetical protein [Pyrolobus fumarii]
MPSEYRPVMDAVLTLGDIVGSPKSLRRVYAILLSSIEKTN